MSLFVIDSLKITIDNERCSYHYFAQGLQNDQMVGWARHHIKGKFKGAVEARFRKKGKSLVITSDTSSTFGHEKGVPLP